MSEKRLSRVAKEAMTAGAFAAAVGGAAGAEIYKQTDAAETTQAAETTAETTQAEIPEINIVDSKIEALTEQFDAWALLDTKNAESLRDALNVETNDGAERILKVLERVEGVDTSLVVDAKELIREDQIADLQLTIQKSKDNDKKGIYTNDMPNIDTTPLQAAAVERDGYTIDKIKVEASLQTLIRGLESNNEEEIEKSLTGLSEAEKTNVFGYIEKTQPELSGALKLYLAEEEEKRMQKKTNSGVSQKIDTQSQSQPPTPPKPYTNLTTQKAPKRDQG